MVVALADVNLHFEERMGPIDAGLWAIEQDPLMRSTMVCVSLVGGAPDRARLTETVDRATRLIPRLRQRVAPAPFAVSTPEFVDDENFDLDYHLRWLRAPGTRTLRDVFEFAAPFAMAGFDRDRPLWEFVVFDDLIDGQAAFVQKMHHSIIDGVGAVKMSLAVMDREPDAPPRPAIPSRPLNVRTAGQLAVSGVRDRVQSQLSAAGTMASTAARLVSSPTELARFARDIASLPGALRPTPTPLSPLMTERSHSLRFDGISANLSELKAAAGGAGCRVNDAFIAAVLGGFDRYHQAHGVAAAELRMTMPVNTRAESKVVEGGNHLAFARFPAPLNIREPRERMQAIRALVADRKSDASLGASAAALGVVGRYPARALVTLFGGLMRGGDIVTSNVPGSPTALYLGGAQILANYAFGPLSGHAVNVTLLSYCGEANLSVGMDPRAVPDQDVLVGCLRDGFDEVAGCQP